MPGIHIKQFAGIMPEIAERNMPHTSAQVAHNCLLRDGSLRAMPEWKIYATTVEGGYLSEDTQTGNTYNVGYKESVFLNGAPFAKNLIVGINDRVEETGATPPGYTGNLFQTATLSGTAGNYPSGIPTPEMRSDMIGIIRNIFDPGIWFVAGLYSQKPVNRMLGISFARKIGGGMQEGPIVPFVSQSPQQLMFEGDILQLSFRLDMDYMIAHGLTHVRIYRTVSGLDSGEKAGNELDTDWHLLATLPAKTNMAYNDGGAATTDPMDLYLAGNFYEPKYKMQHFGMSESGWFYAIAENGKVSISERYLHHAWPVENYLDIRQNVTSAVVHYDNIYVGTDQHPFVVALAPGEGQQGLQASATRFPARLPCLSGTMVATTGGAIYASNKGLVALSRSGQQIITAGLTNAGDNLYKYNGNGSPDVRFEQTTKAAYHEGTYYGFCQDYLGKGYAYHTGDETHGDNKFGQLTTFDCPDALSGEITQALVTKRGLTINGDGKLWYLPLPGEDFAQAGEYHKSKKSYYTWKSKKFVFPGNMTLAVGKLVHDCGGTIYVELYVDCKMVFSADICDCEPFRLPSNIVGKEFEILVSGQRRLHEIHFASSVAELTED